MVFVGLQLNTVKVTDSTGNVRNIFVRYVKEHPVENNDWGDFQTHRRLLGLISLAKYNTQQELNEACRVHESLKVSTKLSTYRVEVSVIFTWRIGFLLRKKNTVY